MRRRNASWDLPISTGDGLPKDDVEAVKWFRKAAEQNHAPSQASLARMLREGWGTSADLAEAVKLLQKAAEQGNAGAQNDLAVLYQRGEECQEICHEARALYQKAADQGLTVSFNNLGIMAWLGLDGTRDIKIAAENFDKSAEQGDATGQRLMGALYLNGWGWKRMRRREPSYCKRPQHKAISMLNSSSLLSRPGAMGCRKISKRRVVLMRECAEKGYAMAQSELGWWLNEGEDGYAR